MKLNQRLLVPFLVIIIGGLIFTSCSNDSGGDDSLPTSKEKVSQTLVGKWILKQESGYYYENGKKITESHGEEELNLSIEIFNDGTYTFYDSEKNSSSTHSWNLSANDDNTYRLTLYGFEDDGYQIQSLSSTTLVLVYEENAKYGDYLKLTFRKVKSS
jgi:hypothetical protein